MKILELQVVTTTTPLTLRTVVILITIATMRMITHIRTALVLMMMMVILQTLEMTTRKYKCDRWLLAWLHCKGHCLRLA